MIEKYWNINFNNLKEIEIKLPTLTDQKINFLRYDSIYLYLGSKLTFFYSSLDNINFKSIILNEDNKNENPEKIINIYYNGNNKLFVFTSSGIFLIDLEKNIIEKNVQIPDSKIYFVDGCHFKEKYLICITNIGNFFVYNEDLSEFYTKDFDIKSFSISFFDNIIYIGHHQTISTFKFEDDKFIDFKTFFAHSNSVNFLKANELYLYSHSDTVGGVVWIRDQLIPLFAIKSKQVSFFSDPSLQLATYKGSASTLEIFLIQNLKKKDQSQIINIPNNIKCDFSCLDWYFEDQNNIHLITINSENNSIFFINFSKKI